MIPVQTNLKAVSTTMDYVKIKVIPGSHRIISLVALLLLFMYDPSMICSI